MHINSKSAPENTGPVAGDGQLAAHAQVMSQLDDQEFGNDQVKSTVKDVVGQVLDVLKTP